MKVDIWKKLEEDIKERQAKLDQLERYLDLLPDLEARKVLFKRVCEDLGFSGLFESLEKDRERRERKELIESLFKPMINETLMESKLDPDKWALPVYNLQICPYPGLQETIDTKKLKLKKEL